MATAQIVREHDILACPIQSYQPPAIIFADPPYNLNKDYGPQSSDDLDILRYRDWTNEWLHRIMTQTNCGCVWCLFPANTKHGLWKPHDKIIWHETFSNYHEHWFPTAHRELHIWRKPNAVWNPDAVRIPSARMLANDKRAKGPRVPDSVWTFPRVCGNYRERVDWHPTQLPYRLLERIVLACSNPGDLVFEAFAGSGILGCVCKDHDRNYLGIEINPDYVSRANTRIGEWNGHPGTHNPSPAQSR